jgi:hypothetical protein
MYLETMFVNINYLAIELMINVVNIVVNINYLAIELIDIVSIVFNSSDVVVNVVALQENGIHSSVKTDEYTFQTNEHRLNSSVNRRID